MISGLDSEPAKLANYSVKRAIVVGKLLGRARVARRKRRQLFKRLHGNTPELAPDSS